MTIAMQIARPNGADVLERVGALVGTLRACEAETNRQGRPSDALIEQLRDTGVFRLPVPRQWGGASADMATWMRAIVELARGDAGVAWGVNLTVSCNWTLASCFPKHVVEEVFSDPRAIVAGVFANRACKARPAEGGILVEKGMWFFNSGVYQANWDLLGVPTFDANGNPGAPGIALVPMGDVQLLHDWDTSGMRGSGSTNVSMENVFIPNERIISLGALAQGRITPPHDEASGRFSFWPVMVNILAYPVVGAGLHMIEQFLDDVPKRDIKLTFYDRADKAASTHLQLGEATSKIEAGQLIVENAVREIDAWAIRGEQMPKLLRAKIFRDSAFANRLIWEGVDLLASAGGGSFARSSNKLNRIWQDVKVGTMHAMITPASNFEHYGRLLTKTEPDMMMV